MNREDDIERFYSIIGKLSAETNGTRLLEHCNGSMNWPNRGIYFFFEPDEYRENGELRVVRVGTHALKDGSKTSLWNRLSQHQGFTRGSHVNGGNHRGSVFRKHIGFAILNKLDNTNETWGKGSSASREIRNKEQFLEEKVSKHIRSMPFLWLKINDDPGPNSHRGFIEKNSIALLSNYEKPNYIDLPSKNWLGNYSNNRKITKSGLWNVNFVEKMYNPKFLGLLKEYVEEM